MNTVAGFDYIALQFHGDGKPTTNAPQELLSHVEKQNVTDVILIAHGFRNDEHDASNLYKKFLTTFGPHLQRPEIASAMAGRKFAVGGVMWPAKSFSEGPRKDAGGVQSVGAEAELETARAQLRELRDSDLSDQQRANVDKALAMLEEIEDNEDKQNEFVSLLLSLVDDDGDDPTEGFQELKSQDGAKLLEKLGTPIILPTQKSGDGGVTSVNAGAAGDGEGKPLFIGGFFKSAAGKVGQLLNVTTWYMMKNRSATVGGAGVADVVRAVKKLPNVRVHLVGHSLGGRCMAACARSLASDPMVQPDSVSLLQAAFSHYGLSKDNGHGEAGYFRDVLAKSVVKGPLVATYSYQDTVVGRAYALSSRLARQNANAIGDKDDQFGGIGRNGAQLVAESNNRTLDPVGTKYTYALKVVNNLDGSGGRIKDHSDVTNAEVTWAVACAVAAT